MRTESIKKSGKEKCGCKAQVATIRQVSLLDRRENTDDPVRKLVQK